MTSDFGGLLDNIQQVSTELGKLSQAIAEARKWRQRAVRLAIIAAVIAAGAFLATGLAILQASRNTDAIHASQLAGCIASNQTRAGEVQLWERAVQVNSQQLGLVTPRQRERTRSFLAYMHRTFHPLDCQRLYAQK